MIVIIKQNMPSCNIEDYTNSLPEDTESINKHFITLMLKKKINYQLVICLSPDQKESLLFFAFSDC